MAQSSKLQVILNSTFSKAQDMSTAKDILNVKKLFQIADGIGANKAESIFHDQRTFTASSTEDLDLSGVLLDAFGVAIAFTKIKTIIVAAVIANTNNVLVGGAASNQFLNWTSDPTDEIVVKPGGVFMLHDPTAGGYAVAAGTGDLLKIANSAGGSSVVYDVIIIGETS